MSSRIERGLVEEHEGYRIFPATFAGYPITIERHADWLTTAYWRLSDEYTFEDFLEAVERAFLEAETQGYETDENPQMAVGSPELERIVMAEYTRPLVPDDFEELGIPADRVSFLRLGDDIAHFTFSRSDRQVGVLFYEKPHQTRSAFRFMAEMVPASPAFSPQEIGKFVLDLPR